MKHAVTICALGLSALFVALIFSADLLTGIVTTRFPALNPEGGIDALQHVMLLALIALPIACSGYALWHLQRLFMAYQAGRIFTAEAANALHRAGWGIALTPLFGMLASTGASVVLTYRNPAGARHLAISLSSNDLGLILLGILLVVIGWVMREAARIHDENRQFV